MNKSGQKIKKKKKNTLRKYFTFDNIDLLFMLFLIRKVGCLVGTEG